MTTIPDFLAQAKTQATETATFDFEGLMLEVMLSFSQNDY